MLVDALGRLSKLVRNVYDGVWTSWDREIWKLTQKKLKKLKKKKSENIEKSIKNWIWSIIVDLSHLQIYFGKNIDTNGVGNYFVDSKVIKNHPKRCPGV